ncbi:hypothetical protein F5X98DRAFT_376846 [Xylaria grammica]|nr:hypothetical protein F5X98DRAFT_376846 [Xylaria grammica]
MAEPLSWLKLGPRARTPSTPLTTNSVEGKASRDPQPGGPRRPTSSRMSSHGTEPSSTDDGAAHLLVRREDQVWYNPSLDQMVEALQVLLMAHGVLHPIPIQYNSYVLHLVEGFASAQESIRRAEAAYQEVKQSLEHNLEQFRLVADDWLERESQYRAEVKRLEVLLSKTSQSGLEAVTLARTNSIVDRSSSSKGGEFLSRLDKLRKCYANDLVSPSNILTVDQVFRTETRDNQSRRDGMVRKERDPERVLTPKILDNDNDFRISEKIRQQDASTMTSTAIYRGRQAYGRGDCLQPDSDVVKRCQDGLCKPFSSITTAPVVASEKHHIHQEAQSPTDTYSRDKVSMCLPSSRNPCHQINTSSKPIISTPDFPIHPSEAAATKTVSQHERDFSEFSFKPGNGFDALPDNAMEKQGGSDPRYSERAPSCPAHRSLEGMAIEKFQRHADDTNDLSTVPASNKGSWLSKTNDSSIQPLPSGADTAPQSPSGKPNRNTHDLDSPLATSATGKDTMQKEQAEMDARIAATLALANVQGSTNQKK